MKTYKGVAFFFFSMLLLSCKGPNKNNANMSTSSLEESSYSEGEVLSYDQNNTVTSISWYHEGQCFFTISPSDKVSFSDMKKVKKNHIHQPHLIVANESSHYHFIFSQTTYPCTLSKIRVTNKLGEVIRLENDKYDLIYNALDFYATVDIFPITVEIAYTDTDGKIIKCYQWDSETNLISEEVNVK